MVRAIYVVLGRVSRNLEHVIIVSFLHSFLFISLYREPSSFTSLNSASTTLSSLDGLAPGADACWAGSPGFWAVTFWYISAPIFWRIRERSSLADFIFSDSLPDNAALKVPAALSMVSTCSLVILSFNSSFVLSAV